MDHFPIPTGIPALDEVLQGLRLGDNVVWQVDNLDDYLHFVRPFAERAISEGRTCVYIRFAPHEPVLEPRDELETVELDPGPGFDYFSGEVHRIIEERGKEVFYIFDNLSALVETWATDELLANFFQVTCPFLFELDTVTYFALTRGRHAHGAVARIRDTTQILVDVYHVDGRMYIHPLKVWDRYSPQMFLPHQVSGESWSPVFESGDAAAVSATARRHPLRGADNIIAPWESVYRRLSQYRDLKPESLTADPEFTASIDASGHVRVNLLQCRPLWLPGSAGPVTIPDVERTRTLFRSSRMISGGAVRDIRHIVYIDPAWYDSVRSPEAKKALGRAVGRINEHPRIAGSTVMMMGPGRWGSSNIDLGINVGYADIDNTSVLVEIAREEAGHVPEVSYGTHFFHDSESILTELLPDAAELAQIVRVIDVPAASGGAHAHVVADPQVRKAVCYLG